MLQKHWPHVKQYKDIKELNYERLKTDGLLPIDIITGGYPCQPFSVAGRKKGEEDPRHLWPEYFRLVKELRPTWVIGENVSGHIKLGLDTVITDVESEDYAVRPFSISASSIGANHQRERVWIVANSRRSRGPWTELREENENETRKENANQSERSSSTSEVNVANTKSHGSFNEQKRDIKSLGRESEKEERGERNKSSVCSSSRSTEMANADSERLEKWESIRKNFEQKQSTFIRTGSKNADVANAERIGQQRQRQSFRSSSAEKNSDGQTGWSYDGGQGAEGWWESEPDVGRVAHGIPKRVDRLKCLGNSLVPQIPYYIGKVILEAMNGKTN